MGGEIEPDMAAAIGAVANPDNWRGLNEAGKKRLQAEIDKNLSPKDKRIVDALVERQQKRGRRG